MRVDVATLPSVIYQAILADYLNADDLLRLANVFKEMGYHNVFPNTFWKQRLETQYGQLIKMLPERKDEESQQISSMLQEQEYREVYRALQTSKIPATALQKKKILSLLKDEQKSEQKEHRDDLKNFLSEMTLLERVGYPIFGLGVSRLADALKTNTTLTYLSLQADHIGDRGAEAITNSLKTNVTLKV